MWYIVKYPTTYIMGIPEREEAEKEQKNIQRNKFQNLVKILIYTSMRVNKL